MVIVISLYLFFGALAFVAEDEQGTKFGRIHLGARKRISKILTQRARFSRAYLKSHRNGQIVPNRLGDGRCERFQHREIAIKLPIIRIQKCLKSLSFKLFSRHESLVSI
jgi:hypothetical protein